MTDIVRPGEVWKYPYLWSREAQAGETEGRKKRPVAVAFLIRRSDGLDHALMLAITTKEPEKGRLSLEVPETEKQRAGLAVSLRQWIILDERNEDTPADSYYFEAGGLIGEFSPKFLKAIQAGKIAAIKARVSKGVNRRDD